MPDNSDSCPICGRRQDEQPIGKLLSENLPNPVAAEEAREEAIRAGRASSSSSESGSKPKSLATPILAVLLAAAGWMYGMSNNVIDTIRSIFNSITGSGTQLASDSDFAAGNAASTLQTPAGLIAIAVILLTVLGIIGFITFISRVVNNIKDDRE